MDLAVKTGIELTPDGLIKHDAHHRTNIPAIYSAGDVEGGFRQIVTAMGQGTEAALSVFEDLMHPYWKEKAGTELLRLAFPPEPACLRCLPYRHRPSNTVFPGAKYCPHRIHHTIHSC